MKKLYSLLTYLLFGAAVFVSCETQEPMDTDQPTDQPQTSSLGEIKVTVPSSENSIEMSWENKDAIALRCQEDSKADPTVCTYTATLAAPKATVTLKKKSGEKNVPTKLDGKYIAMFPASGAYVQWEKDASVVIAPSADQTVKNKKLDRSSAYMIASSENSEFTFKNLVSYIKFTISSNGSQFSSVTVTSRDKSQYMVSPIKVKFDKYFSYTLQTAASEQAKTYVSLKSSDNANLPAGTYYIAINPGTYSKGFKVTFENASGHTATKEFTGSYKPKPGGVVDLGEVGNLGFQMSLPHIQVYKKNNQKLGVVFYQDPSNAGKTKVVSAASILTKWANNNEELRIKNYKADYDYVHTIVVTSDKYKANANNLPAVKFCEQMRKDYGGNWHVPSTDELKMLFNGYYGKEYNAELVNKTTQYTDNKSKSAALYFDSLLESMGANTFLEKSNEYWGCGQNSGGNMQYVNMKLYHNGNAAQTEERYVRCVRDVDSSVSDDKVVYPTTDVGRLIKGALTTKVIDVTKDETYSIVNGLEYYKMTVLTDAEASANRKQNIYLLRADLTKGLDVKSVVSNQTTSKTWHLQKLSEMAANVNTSSKPLYAMINADFTDSRTGTAIPRGPVHCSGKIWQSAYNLDVDFPQQGLSYVGMTNDGKMTIGSREDYPTSKSTLRDCSGGGLILLKDSKIVGLGESRDPRTSIGFTSTNIVWILVVDGRHGTTGMTYTELASVFQGLGCLDAVALDGGGSTQLLGRNPSTGKIQMLNWPSDPTDGAGGEERARLNAWVIVKK